jgi:replicative DNA helicase
MAKQIDEKAAAKQVERNGLAALLVYNEYIAEVMGIFKAEFFNWKEHQTIYTLITSIYQEKGSVDQTVLILKLDQVGLKEINGLDMAQYIKTLCSLPTNKEFILDYFREIYKMHTCRKMFVSLGQAQTFINQNLSKSLSDIVSGVEKITIDSVSANIEEKTKIIKPYEELPRFLLELSERPLSSFLKTGFKNFDAQYGGLIKKGVYFFAAPSKVGKSTFLGYMAYQMTEIVENNLKVLILDTELESEFCMTRAISALTGINEYEFLEGDFAKNVDFANRTKQALSNIGRPKDRIFHSYVANLNIDEIISMARRWYIQNIHPGENALIVYDYVKLSGGENSLSDHWKEYQEIGEKTDKLKKFISSLPNASMATSIQLNAQGNVAMSQQVLWFANSVFILKRKTLEEIQNDGESNGTHVLIEKVSRNLGRAHDDSFSVKNKDGVVEHLQNWINFKFHNFRVDEINTRRDVYTQKAIQLRADKGCEDEIDF